MLNVRESVLLQGYARTGITATEDQHVLPQGYFSPTEPPPSAGAGKDILYACPPHHGAHASRDRIGPRC